MGWSTENLGDLYKIGSSKRVLKSQWQTSGVPFYRGREITVLSKHGKVSNELFISEELYQEHAKKHGVPSAEDIVITAIGTIGNSYIVSENDRFYFKDASVLWLKKTSSVNSSFINLWLKSPLMREQLDEGNGATVDTLTIKKLQSLKVKLPPIPEQQRIVAILDQAFADIERARANAEKNLKNARELFDSYLNQVLSGESNGMGWGAKKLSEVCTHIFAGGDVPKDRLSRYKTSDYQVPIFSNGEKNKGLYGFTDVPRVHDASITVSARGTIGYSEIRYEPFLPVVRLIVLTPNPEMVTLGFLNYAIKGIGFVNSGSSIPQLTVPMIKEYKCILPSIPEQQRIVASLDKLSKQVQQLERVCQEKLTSLEELKKSLLQKAFSGELTRSKGIAV